MDVGVSMVKLTDYLSDKVVSVLLSTIAFVRACMCGLSIEQLTGRA